MALTYTLRSAVSGTGAADTLATASFTPSSISLLVAVATGLLPDGRASAPTISNTGTALTWTNRLDLVHTNGWASTVQIWTAPVATGAAMVVTVDYNATTLDAGGGHGLVVIEFTGHDTSNPVVQTFQDGGTTGRTGAYSGTLGVAPAATNYVITGAVADAANAVGLTAGTGWTLIQDDSIGDGASLIQYRTGTVSTNVGMNDFTQHDPNWSWAIGGIEIKVKAATSAVVTFDATDTDTATITNGNSYTFTPSATAASSGQERLAILGGIAGTDSDYSTVTIDGQSATRVGSIQRGATATSGFKSFITLYRANGTATSGSINIAATYTGTNKSCVAGYCALYRLSDVGTLFASTSSASNDPTLSCNAPNNGAVVGSLVGFSATNPTATWAGLTENYDSVRAAADQVFTGGSASTTAAATPRTMSANVQPNLTGLDDSIASITASFSFATAVTAYTILAVPGNYTVSGSTVGTVKGQKLGLDATNPLPAGSHALTGDTATGLFGRLVTAPDVEGSYTLTGTSATLTGSVGSLGPIARTYEANYADDITKTSGQSYTIPLTVSDASGTGVERLVFLGSITSAPGDVENGDFTSVTIDGVAAERVGTVLRSAVDVNHFHPWITAYRADGTANTTIDVVATFESATGGSSVSVSCTLYKLEGAGTVFDINYSALLDPVLDVNTIEDGAILACTFTYNGSDPFISWTGITHDVRSLSSFGQDWMFGASELTTIDESPRTVTGDNQITAGTDNRAASIIISFSPAEGGGASGSGSITADAGTHTITGSDATLSILGHVNIETGSYTLTGFDVGLSKTGANQTVGTTSGIYAITGSSQTITFGKRVQALTTGSYTISGDTVTSGDGLLADAGSYAITGSTANLVYVAGSGGGVAAFVDVTGMQMTAGTADASVTITGGIAVTVSGNALGVLASTQGATVTTVTTTGGINVSVDNTGLLSTVSVGTVTVTGSAQVAATGNSMTASVGTATVTSLATVSVSVTGLSMRVYVEPVDHAGSGYVPGTVVRKQVRGEMFEVGRWMGH